MELNRQTKMAEVAKMKEAEKAMAQKIDKLVSGGDLDDDAQRRGCGGGCFPFLSRRGRSRVAQESGMEVAVFGQSAAGAGAASTNARLEKAAEQMESHAAQLYAKAGASRSKAKALMAQGKKQEAMLALKRAKALEKQAEVAASTHAAIEQQQEMLQSSALQREVASALSASIATTKKKTRGLLEKAESAVDGSAELRDVAEEINEVMGGLAKADDYDEEDLWRNWSCLRGSPTTRRRRQQRRRRPRRHCHRRPMPRQWWSHRRSWWASTPRSSHPRPRRSARSSKSCWRPIRPPRSEQRFQGRTLESKSRDPAHGGRVPALRMGGEPLHGR